MDLFPDPQSSHVTGCLVYTLPDLGYPKAWIGGAFPDAGGERDTTATMCDNTWQLAPHGWKEWCHVIRTDNYPYTRYGGHNTDNDGRRQLNKFECERENTAMNTWEDDGDQSSEQLNNAKCLIKAPLSHTLGPLLCKMVHQKNIKCCLNMNVWIYGWEQVGKKKGPVLGDLLTDPKPSSVAQGCSCSSHHKSCYWSNPNTASSSPACVYDNTNKWECHILNDVGSPSDDTTDTLETESMCEEDLDTEWFAECYEDVGNRVLSSDTFIIGQHSFWFSSWDRYRWYYGSTLRNTT